MLDILGTLFSSILAGGATGLIGVIAQRWADYKNKQLDITAAKDRMAHEAVMRDKDAAILSQEWAGRTRVAEVEAGATIDATEAQAFTASFQHDKAAYSVGAIDKLKGWWGQCMRFLLGLVDVIRGLVRPGLTVYLCAVTTLMYLEASQRLGAEDLTAAQALELVKMIVATVLYLTTTCVLWWFGTRNKQAPPR